MIEGEDGGRRGGVEGEGGGRGVVEGRVVEGRVVEGEGDESEGELMEAYGEESLHVTNELDTSAHQCVCSHSTLAGSSG